MVSVVKKNNKPIILFALMCLWLALLLSQPSPILVMQDYGVFAFLGVVGAIFANATGAGGGVVFVPFFQYLQFSPDSIVATSFGIQCCGMTAGALTWAYYFKNEHKSNVHWKVLPNALILCVPASLSGILFAQYSEVGPTLLTQWWGGLDNLHILFGVFSVLLSLAIFASIPLLKRTQFTCELTKADILALPFISFMGAIVTAWLSVGVGELVAVYLIVRGFNVTMSIAVAVILSAFTVWAALPYHLFVSPSVVFEVVLFSGIGAIVGGMLAKHVVLAFSVQKLKLFFGGWVFILGVASLPIF